MGPIERSHPHQMVENWILPIGIRPINSLLFTKANHVPPKDVVIGETSQGVIVPTTLLETLGSRHDDAMAHTLGNLDPLDQQHQRADVKVGRTT